MNTHLQIIEAHAAADENVRFKLERTLNSSGDTLLQDCFPTKEQIAEMAEQIIGTRDVVITPTTLRFNLLAGSFPNGH